MSPQAGPPVTGERLPKPPARDAANEYRRLVAMLAAKARWLGSRDPESAAQETLTRSLENPASQAAVQYYFSQNPPDGLHNPDWPLDTFLATPWNTPLSEINESNHWTWVREPFLSATPGPQGFSGYFVVHGHSPSDLGFTRGHAEQIARFRLNLDGGSGHTGRAKLAIFRGRKVEVLTVSGATNRGL